jgi:hypothetical protein
LVVLVVVLVIGALLAMARGREHHRGDEVGASGPAASASA